MRQISLGDLNAKVGRESILKPTIRNESLHEISNGNGARAVNFDTSENNTVNSRIFPYRNIKKYTWTSLDGRTHNQIEHIPTDRSRHSSVLDILSFTAAYCNTNYYLLVTKFKERLAVNKQKSYRFHNEILNPMSSFVLGLK
jgi:hypothetical protein